MAAMGEDAPLVASKSGADWEVLENAMAPQEVHTKRKVVRLHSVPFRYAVSTIHLMDAPFLRGAWNRVERVHERRAGNALKMKQNMIIESL